MAIGLVVAAALTGVMATAPATAAAKPAIAATAPATAKAATAAAKPIAPQAALAADELLLQADQTAYDEATDSLEAVGHVVIDRPDLHVEAQRLHLDLKQHKGHLYGPLHAKGGGFELDAASATFDLIANSADIEDFRGLWANHAKFAGKHLSLAPRVFKLDDAWITNCFAPEPDLKLVAKNFHFFPLGRKMNLAGQGVALQVWDRKIVELPYFNTTLDRHEKDGNGPLDVSLGNIFPAFGFDAYRGFLTGTRLDFSLGDNSRGSIPISFSTARGWSGGIEHVLDLGPGEFSNAVNLETPWATGHGGLRATNQYSWSLKEGARLEINADYRADLNGEPVHRLPDLVYYAPTMGLGRYVAIHNELHAGYLWEESSGQQATRLRWDANCTTSVWNIWGPFRTYITALPFFNHYIFQAFGGFTSAWNNDQSWRPGLTSNEAVEFSRVYGATPFIHDRQYDAERLRLGINEDWAPFLTTNLSGSWSRLNQAGPFSVEDVSFTNTYHWNCFGFSLVVHPLVWGVDAHIAAGMF